MDLKLYRLCNASFAGPRAVPAEAEPPALLLEVYRDGIPHRTIQASEPSLKLSMAALGTLSLGQFWSFEHRI